VDNGWDQRTCWERFRYFVNSIAVRLDIELAKVLPEVDYVAGLEKRDLKCYSDICVLSYLWCLLAMMLYDRLKYFKYKGFLHILPAPELVGSRSWVLSNIFEMPRRGCSKKETEYQTTEKDDTKI
jgi:hypothetical protein